MTEKTFRIISNSDEHLQADIIAAALLKQVTLDPAMPGITFAVMELNETFALSKHDH
jgi:hypothetical protein